MRPITALTLAAVLALGACSSDDGDDVLDPNASGPGDTSELNPDLGDPDAPPSNDPGGDTSAVAGLWDASPDDVAASSYVDITEDGLWTRYDVPTDGGTCYDVTGPFTLTPEFENDYSLAGEDEALTLVAAGDVLTYRLGTDGPVETWERTTGQVNTADLESCGDF